MVSEPIRLEILYDFPGFIKLVVQSRNAVCNLARLRRSCCFNIGFSLSVDKHADTGDFETKRNRNQNQGLASQGQFQKLAPRGGTKAIIAMLSSEI
jgi:hypothetical protein